MIVARSTFHIASVENGESAVSYEIALDTNSVTADGNTGKFLTTKLGKYHFVKHTGSKAEDCAGILDTFNFLILLVGKNGDVLPGGSTSGSATGEIYGLFSGGSIKEEDVSQIKFFWYSAPIIKLGDYNYLKNLEKLQGIPTKNMPFTILASNTFLIVRQGADGKPGGKGDPGARGSSGPVWRQHVGFVSATADAPYQYYAGSNDERFIDVVLIGKVWYRCLQSYKSTGTDDIRNTMTNAEFAEFWTSADMANFTFIATQFLLASNAKINLFGSNEINLYGSDAEGKIFASFRVPNGNGDDSLYALWIGATTGAKAPFSVTKDGWLYAFKGTFAGELKGVVGSFHKLAAVSSDGKKSAGSIYFDSSGYITFDADIYSQGVNSERTRGWRFYASTIWSRGAFGHNESTLAVINGASMRIYPDGYHFAHTVVRLESTTYDNKTVYKIPLYSPDDKSSGCPIDVVVFNSSRANAEYYYEFVPGGTGKRWMAINANDINNGIHFCDVGGWHQLNGGETINLVYINPELLNPSQKDKTYFGRGIFWSGEHDLDWSNR